MKTGACGFSGGQNTATDAVEIKPTECVLARNWDYQKYIQGATRNGYVRYTNTRFKDAGARAFRILGLTNFYYGAGLARDVFVGFAEGGGTEELRYVTGHLATKVTYDSSISVGADGYPYSFETIGDRLIGCNGQTTPWSWNGTAGRSAFALGIAAPATGLSAAAGGAGLLTGSFRYVVLFQDGVDKVKSAASPVSTVISVAGKQLALTNIPTSTSGRVTTRLLYRTQATGLPSYYLLATIADNSTTTYTDNTIDAGLGIELVQGGPPPVCRIPVAYKGVLWLFTDTMGYYSQPENYEEFPYGADVNTGYVDFGSDGGEILGAYVAMDQLVVVQRRKINVVYGDRPANRQVQSIESRQGQDWAFAGTTVHGDIFFANREALWRHRTNTVQKAQNRRSQFMPQQDWDSIRNQPGQSAASYGNEVRIFHHERARQLWISANDAGATGPNNFTLIYNYWRDEGPWSRYSFGFDVAGYWRANFADKTIFVFAQDGLQGFVFRGDYGPLDSIASAGDMYGEATGGTATTITDTAASFPTDGDGLFGAVVTVVQQTTKIAQQAMIASNTSTALTVASFLRFTPAAGDLYIIGAFVSTIKSGRLTWGDSESEKSTRKLRMRIESR